MIEKVLLYTRPHPGSSWKFNSLCFGQEDIERKIKRLMEQPQWNEHIQIGYITYQTGQAIKDILEYDEPLTIVYGLPNPYEHDIPAIHPRKSIDS